MKYIVYWVLISYTYTAKTNEFNMYPISGVTERVPHVKKYSKEFINLDSACQFMHRALVLKSENNHVFTFPRYMESIDSIKMEVHTFQTLNLQKP